MDISYFHSDEYADLKGRLIEKAVEGYEDYEFHNLDHAVNEVLPIVEEIGLLCVEDGIWVAFDELAGAAVLHDYGLPTPMETCFPSKEHRSAHLAGPILRDLGMVEGKVRHAQGHIISTERKHLFRNVGDAILGCGDMNNATGVYEEDMRPRTYDLMVETRRMQQKDIRPGAWLEVSVPILRDYERKAASIPAPVRHLAPFVLYAAKLPSNIDLLERETPKSFLDNTQPHRQSAQTTGLIAS